MNFSLLTRTTSTLFAEYAPEDWQLDSDVQSNDMFSTSIPEHSEGSPLSQCNAEAPDSCKEIFCGLER